MKYISLTLIFCLLAGCAAVEPAPPDSTMAAKATPAAAPIRLFRQYLSGADGHRCPMTPSCSSYALQAMQRHGAVVGWIMTCDRLMRCGRDELKHRPPLMTRDGVRCPDPVHNNDFWWD